LTNNISQNQGNLIKNTLFLPTCHSTNSYAHNWLSEHEVDEGWAVYTFRQTNGRGQGDNTWESEPDKNLTFSVVYKPDYLLPKDQFWLNMATSLGILSFLKSMCISAKVKWPNDVYVNGKKMAGMLIENQLRGNSFRHSIIGIGLNVNQKEFKTANATSMMLATNQEYNLKECLKVLLQHIDYQINRLKNVELKAISEEYTHNMFQYNTPALYKTGELIFTGTITGVDETGRLTIQTSQGEKIFNLKEIKFLTNH
jgi:BirA family biotin operon repressor/biotin-[acetyl-CoA-carboxylase] ligase